MRTLTVAGAGESETGEWMSKVLALAGMVGLLWGGFNLVNPDAAFDLVGAQRPTYPEFWQGIGAGGALLGLAYLIASLDPLRHWLLVMTGLMLKGAVIAGFFWSVSLAHIPWSAGWIPLFTEAVWIPPFAAILAAAYENHLQRRRRSSRDVFSLALRARTQYGATLDELNRLSPVLVVFLRHFGCTFCREALADLAKQRKAIEANGTRIVLVHMGSEPGGETFVRKYGLDAVPRISDPQCSLYRAFGLQRGSLAELLGPRVWWRGFQAAVLGRHGIGKLAGDGFQMPGVFLLYHGSVLRSYVHQSAADRPDYIQLSAQEDYSRAG